MPTESPTLPKVMSELLEIAIEDLRKVEKMDGYGIAMGEWHSYMGGVCYVCMAGAVMAARLKAPKSGNVTPSDYRDLASQLNAIDHIRLGLFRTAAEYLSINTPIPAELREKYEPTSAPDYGTDAFYPFYESMIADLKAAGL